MAPLSLAEFMFNATNEEGKRRQGDDQRRKNKSNGDINTDQTLWGIE